jgi:sn1-specific diacylglycerol lipase
MTRGAAGYKLRLTGHSLGAGCAAVLSFMLKPKFPDLRCLSFSPPGCTMSANMADSCKGYLTSYVLDDDIVPRMSLESMEHLRNDMLLAIARIKVTKHEAMSKKSQQRPVDTILNSIGSVPPSLFSKQLEDFGVYQRKKKDEFKSDYKMISLYPPGNIVHVVSPDTRRTGSSSCCGSSCSKVGLQEEELPYGAHWAHLDDLAEVIISPHFVDDHKSPNVLLQLERVAEDFGLASPFLIEKPNRT